MPDILSLDYETACDLDITKVGLDRYTAHLSFRVLMAAYRINDGPIEHWQAHERPVPRDLRDALRDPKCQRWAFNSQFERVVTRRGLRIDTPIEGWRCSMVLAYTHSFTGGLADVGKQMGFSESMQKDRDGKRLIRKFSMPQRITKNQPHLWRNWITDPEDWDLFCRYNRQDLVPEEEIRRRLNKYPILPDEWSFYGLDQEINDEGMPIDIRFVQNVMEMSERRKDELLDEMRGLTRLDNPNSQSQLLRWLQKEGYPYDDIQAHTVSKVLGLADSNNIQISGECLEVLKLRQWAGKISPKKAATAIMSIGEGDRIRYSYQFAGASRTHRFAGRIVQFQNIERTPKILDPENGSEKLDLATEMVRNGEYDNIELFIDEPMRIFGGCMRGMIRAPEGWVLEVCDYRSIESIALSWMVSCERLLEKFRNGVDPYYDFGVSFLRKPYDQITKAERQICKPPQLGCGYRLGPGKVLPDGRKTGLLAYAENMGVQLTPEQAQRAVSIYRQVYQPETVQFWYGCEAAIKHVLTTHQHFDLGWFRFEWKKPYLLIRLPSGRYVYYYNPGIQKREIDTGRTKWVRSEGMSEDGAPKGELVEVLDTYVKDVFSYMGRNQHKPGGPWERIEAHGGVTTENLDQAFCHDILKVGMQRCKADGFKIVGHTHDEIITMRRIDDEHHTWQRMKELMCQPIDWAPGFPLGAAGYSAQYYRK